MSSTLRADAQRNLGRVLDAAAEVLAEQGLSASVDEIAKRAGVGHGTVFRRFPTKEALVAAVVCKRLEEISATAEELLDHPDAGEAFEAFVWQMAEVYARDRCIFEGLPRCAEIGEVMHAKARFLDLVARLLEPGPERPCRACRPRPRGRADARRLGDPRLELVPEGEPWRRFVTVVLDGMRLRP